MASDNNRGQWGSNLGFILAAAGSAVGLGNIWRFPYITGQNGGAAFVIVYLICVLLIGLPLLFNEIGLGRFTRKNPIGAVLKTSNKKGWLVIGGLSFFACFFVLSYYSVIAGWAIGYVITTIGQSDIAFDTFTATPMYIFPLFILFILINIFIVQGGVEKGIERAAKIMMPLLFVLMLVVIVRSLTLPGAMEGISFYLYPDFSKIDMGVIVQALGQAFFSMSVGWGLMITYGSYLSQDDNIISSAGWIAGLDTLVALLGGLMIFPAVFAMNMEPSAGPTLIFEVLPKVFGSMPMGSFIGALFFVLLTFGALTSSISMLEVPVSYFVDETRVSRKVATWGVAIIALIVGIPSALSFGASEFWSGVTLLGKEGFLNIMDQVWGVLAITILSFLLSVYVGWAIKTSDIADEINKGAPFFKNWKIFGVQPATYWVFFIRIICPLVVLIVLVNIFFEMAGISLFG